MKKLILVCAVLCLTAATASAQLVRFGVKGGLSMHSTDIKGDWLVGGDQIIDANMKSKNVGYHFGIMSRISIPLTGLYVQPELVYNHAAYKLEIGNTETVKYNNIELPVLLGFKILFLRLQAGPTFTLGSFNSDGDIFDIKRPDVGFQAGLGLTIKNITLDVRYQGYFEKKWKDIHFEDLGNKFKANDGFWNVSLGYFF